MITLRIRTLPILLNLEAINSMRLPLPLTTINDSMCKCVNTTHDTVVTVTQAISSAYSASQVTLPSLVDNVQPMISCVDRSELITVT